MLRETPTVFAALRQVGFPSLLNAITGYGIDAGMENETRKITVHVPAALLESAQAETGEGVTETVRKGLELLRRANAYRRMQQMRGKVKFDLTLEEIRSDRR